MLSCFAPLLAALSLQAALDARAAAAPGTGIAVGVVDHGVQRIYVAGGAGNGRAVDAHTLFEIGSVTKTFTATALAAMVLRKEVRLADPISEFLPPGVHAPSKDGRRITLLDLAEQRSGLPRLPTNMDDVLGEDPYSDYTVAEMYSFLNGYVLTRDPGATYEYSNYGIGLLGQLLANRAKMPYASLVRDTVLNPLGMSETGFAEPQAPDPALLAAGHDLSGAAAPAWHFQSVMPAGGIVSNLTDMLKYLRCNMGQGPLARACLFAQRPRAPGEAGHKIGLAWNVSSATGNISHAGDTIGFHADLAISRDREVGVVVLSNGPAVTDIASHVLMPSYPIGGCLSSVAAADTDASSYAGIYCNAMGAITFSVETTAKPNELAIALSPQPKLIYQRVSDDTYYAQSVGATFKFLRAGGAIVGLRLTQIGQTIPAVRLDAQGKPVVARLPPAFPPVVPLDRATLAQYVGTYALDGGSFTVTLRGDALFVQLTGQPAVRIYASAKDDFYLKVVEAQITFNRNAAGSVTSLTLHQNGQTIRAARQ
ncbi:MAG: serine hydrolase [Candidatus Eremiobacteraeota bacterium]|nr:serine hydrolase [Candidatus Eremiobacteraeota bacterium]